VSYAYFSVGSKRIEPVFLAVSSKQRQIAGDGDSDGKVNWDSCDAQFTFLFLKSMTFMLRVNCSYLNP
jgi:hypothetical protein